MGIFGPNKYDLLETRVRRLEALVAQLAAGESVDVSPGGLAGLHPDARSQAQLLKQQGKAIQAIKFVREQTGLGLREAKELVDGL
ncbi:MAG: 50S ribosomal protein L12 [Intrasporangiaceae bacterium]|nr:50S ribosomal protein L12 [Intrasporangiaceae bacterium]